MSVTKKPTKHTGKRERKKTHQKNNPGGLIRMKNTINFTKPAVDTDVDVTFKPVTVTVAGQAFTVLQSAHAFTKAPKPDGYYIGRIRKGVSGNSLKNMMHKNAISIREMANIMDMDVADVQRLSTEKKLDVHQSEKAVLIEKLYERGTEVFETKEAFREWMNSKVTALGNKQPRHFLDTVIGISLVADELERLAYGVFS